MNKHFWVAGIAAAALFPSFASAQTTCEQQHDRRVAGTVVGAVAGALIGNAVSRGGGREGGTIIGGVAGAAIGNEATRPSADCAHAYGFYDRDGRWHANNVEMSQAQGYYDREGQWQNGAPAGYADVNGHWVPSAAGGYYDVQGVWVAGAAPGYHDADGRWVQGATVGSYDQDGRWRQGQAGGHFDANNAWIADPQPGYWDNGAWRRGPANGFYGADGRWVAAEARAPMGQDRWANADTQTREQWLGDRIQRMSSTGAIDHDDMRRAEHTLKEIRRDDAQLRSDGAFDRNARAGIQDRLDNLATSLRIDWQDSHGG